MKYLKNFKTYEAIIVPEIIEDKSPINSFDDLVRYGEKNGFDVVDYDGFYISLNEQDKKTAPPRHDAPFFAYFNSETNKPTFVYVDRRNPMIEFMPDFKDILNGIISHEMVHGGQISRMKDGINYKLPDPKVMSDYFSNKEEIMAFSWNLANSLKSRTNDFKRANELLKLEQFPMPILKMWKDIKTNVSDKVLNRYRKYIYLYLVELYKKEEDKK
jgi:hypothetical protein